MAHEIDTTTGQAAMAYVGQTPWHGLGQRMPEHASIEQWRAAAKLEWESKRAPVLYQNGELREFSEKHVLYRSDTNTPLSVVSADYQIVQPEHVLAFFKDLAEQANIQIETVGALKQGRRIWALGRIGQDARIMDDVVAPYLLLATSYDGTMATLAKFTSVRVVCNNTLQASLRNREGQNQVAIPHSAVFNPVEVRQRLGIALDSWEEFLITSQALAGHKMTDPEMDSFLLDLIEPPYGKVYTPDQIRHTKGYQRIQALFNGAQIGGQMDAMCGTAWGALNAVTQYVDHEKGRLQDNRLDAAWFGPGAKFKQKALELIQKVAA